MTYTYVYGGKGQKTARGVYSPELFSEGNAARFSDKGWIQNFDDKLMIMI